MVKARELPKELSTCVCTRSVGRGVHISKLLIKMRACLRRKVHDGVYALVVKEEAHEVRALYLPFDELGQETVSEAGQVMAGFSSCAP